jgi:hypothetical protein
LGLGDRSGDMSMLFWRDVLLIMGLAFLSEGFYIFYMILKEIRLKGGDLPC